MNIGLLVLSFTTKGGIERIVPSLGEGLAARGHHCTLFHPCESSGHYAYPVPDTIRHILLPPFPVTQTWLKSARTILHDANIDILCALTSSSQARILPSLCHGLHIPLVLSEHSNPYIIETERWSRVERLACMAGSDAVHLLCRNFLLSLPPQLRERATVIPNFSNLSAAVTPPFRYRQNKRLLTVARLYEPAKQLSLLLHAFALLKNDFPDWECRICGGGPSQKRYEKLITTLNLNAEVTLAGDVEDVAAEYTTADIFVFPSRYEGFPIALVEAQGFGLPGVGFAACTGVNEIIVHGENGLLAPEMTAESLAEQLRILMSDEHLRQRMGARARELSTRYDKERILDQWEALFQNIVNRPGPVALDMVDTINDTELRNNLRRLQSTVPPDSAMTTNLMAKLRLQVRQHMMYMETPAQFLQN